jgi:hypothetical protein
MSYIKADNPTEQKHFDFLEELRQSGETNMFGAERYLYEEFPNDFDRQGHRSPAASACLRKWFKLHDDPTRVIDKPEVA